LKKSFMAANDPTIPHGRTELAGVSGSQHATQLGRNSRKIDNNREPPLTPAAPAIPPTTTIILK